MSYIIGYYSDELQAEILAMPPGILADCLRLSDLLSDFGPGCACLIQGQWARAFSSCVPKDMKGSGGYFTATYPANV